jgi:hypothetical protein
VEVLLVLDVLSLTERAADEHATKTWVRRGAHIAASPPRDGARRNQSRVRRRGTRRHATARDVDGAVRQRGSDTVGASDGAARPRAEFVNL